MIPIKDKIYDIEFISYNEAFENYIGRAKYTGEIEDSDSEDSERLYWFELLDAGDNINSHAFFHEDDIVRELS